MDFLGFESVFGAASQGEDRACSQVVSIASDWRCRPGVANLLCKFRLVPHCLCLEKQRERLRE